MPSNCEHRRRMMIVEPDRLTRWSITAYFAGEYAVVAAESADTARALLEEKPMDAIVVADDLPGAGADAIETFARSRNGRVRVVRTVTSPAPASRRSVEAPRLEKPFQLASLAALLSA